MKDLKLHLKGLNCSNCAAKIENDVNKMKTVSQASINLMKGEFAITYEDVLDRDELIKEVQRIVTKYEPDVKVLASKTPTRRSAQGCGCGGNHGHDHGHNNGEGCGCGGHHGHHHDDGCGCGGNHGHEHDDGCGCGGDHGHHHDDGCGCGHDHDDHHHHHGDEGDFKPRFIKYGIGIVIFLFAVAIKMPVLYKNLLLGVAYLIFGLDVLVRAVKNISRGQVFDENFLMSISTLGALAIGEIPEAVFVMLFYQVGETFQDIAVGRSRKSIKELMNIKPEFANIKTETGFEKVAPETIKIDDIIIVKPGEKVPLDGVVIEGKSQVDTVALTGESVPRSIFTGDEVLNGSINMDGVLTIKVTKIFQDSTVMKILEMVENASSKKSKTEQFITKFARVYTPIVVMLAVVLAFLPPIITPEKDLSIWIGRALIFLVVSCPCALVLSVPLGFFSGVGAASKRGILVKGSNYIQALSEVDTVVFDKTGTITEGVFKVNEIKNDSELTDQELLKIVSACEKLSNHPIAKSIVDYAQSENNVGEGQIQDFMEIRGQGLYAKYDGMDVYLGNKTLMEKQNIHYTAYEGLGSVVYIGVNGKNLGYITVSDKIKADTKKAVEMFKALGIKELVMLTGDNQAEAEKVCTEIGINKYYAQLLPQNKVEKIEDIYCANTKTKIAFVGDGINDAPVLSRVDVGVAMGGVGSDAAIEAADAVIMNDSLVKVAEGIKISRSTVKIVKQNIVFALGIKFIVLVLGALGLASMWAAVFADVGVSFICILNSMRRKI